MIQTPALPPECTVLFADLVGSTQLYESVGDSSAFELVDRCLKELHKAIEDRGGRVVKHTGDGLMAIFAETDKAADAAVGMHQSLRELPLLSGQRLAVRIGFNWGSVIESGDDVFGETVNFAARLMELASPGRALTTAETFQHLTTEWKELLQPLQPRVLRGASRPSELFELKCEAMGDVTVLHTGQFEIDGEHELKLYLNEQALVLNEQCPVVRIGRDATADLRVGDSRASRRHAEIELRGDKFVVVDRSSNGTYVTIDGEKEFMLSREEAVLRGRGHIALGGGCSGNPFAISFICV